MCAEGFSPGFDLNQAKCYCKGQIIFNIFSDCNDKLDQQSGPDYYQDCSYCSVDGGVVKECLACSSGFLMTNKTTKKTECLT